MNTSSSYLGITSRRGGGASLRGSIAIGEVSSDEITTIQVEGITHRSVQDDQQSQTSYQRAQDEQIMQSNKIQDFLQEQGIELQGDGVSVRKIAAGASDLEWFMFETKIRQIIVELTEPVQRKAYEIQKEAALHIEKINSFEKQMKEYDIFIQKMQQFSGNIDEISLKQSNLKAELDKQCHRMILDINMYDDRIKTIEGQQILAMKACYDLEKTFKQVKHYYDDLVKEARDVNTESREFSLAIKQEYQYAQSGIDKKIVEFEAVAQQVKFFQKQQTDDFDHFHKDFSNHEIKTQNQIDVLIDKIEKVNSHLSNDVVQFCNDVTCLKKQYLEQNLKFGTIEYYLDKILPVKTHSQICNTIHSTLSSPDDLRNLMVFEQQHYQNLIKDFHISGTKNYKLLEYDTVIPKLPLTKDVISSIKSSSIFQQTIVKQRLMQTHQDFLNFDFKQNFSKSEIQMLQDPKIEIIKERSNEELVNMEMKVRGLVRQLQVVHDNPQLEKEMARKNEAVKNLQRKDFFYLSTIEHDKGLFEAMLDVKVISATNFVKNSYKFQLYQAKKIVQMIQDEIQRQNKEEAQNQMLKEIKEQSMVSASVSLAPSRMSRRVSRNPSKTSLAEQNPSIIQFPPVKEKNKKKQKSRTKSSIKSSIKFKKQDIQIIENTSTIREPELVKMESLQPAVIIKKPTITEKPSLPSQSNEQYSDEDEDQDQDQDESDIGDYVNFEDLRDLKEQISQEINQKFEEMFTNKKEEIRKDIRENVTQKLPELIEKVRELRGEFDGSLVQQAKKQREFQQTIQEVCSQMDCQLNKTSKERADLTLIFNRISASLTDIISYTNWCTDYLISLSKKVNYLIESDEINATIEQYDDSLVELQHFTLKDIKDPVLYQSKGQFLKMCNACEGGKLPSMTQAFKMACLAQQENQIMFKFEKFDRKILLKNRQEIINKAKEIKIPENPNKEQIRLPTTISAADLESQASLKEIRSQSKLNIKRFNVNERVALIHQKLDTSISLMDGMSENRVAHNVVKTIDVDLNPQRVALRVSQGTLKGEQMQHLTIDHIVKKDRTFTPLNGRSGKNMVQVFRPTTAVTPGEISSYSTFQSPNNLTPSQIRNKKEYIFSNSSLAAKVDKDYKKSVFQKRAHSTLIQK